MDGMVREITAGSCSRVITLYIRGLCIIVFIAFASLYIQLPGLYGCDGLLPVESFMSRVTHANWLSVPSLLWLRSDTFVVKLTGQVLAVDTCMDLIALLGMVVSILGVIGYQCGLILMAQFVLYISFVSLGQDFLSFQWDILILELTAVSFLAVPLLPSRKPAIAPGFAVWLLRFVLFKFMFLNGVVKVQSKCPAWSSLNALTYHWATQCLPLPLAWHMAQLPPVINKINVAIALVIEIPATILILAPQRWLRRIAFVLNVLLQIGIVTTGNFTFFNYATMVMCLVLLDDRDLPTVPKVSATPITTSRHPDFPKPQLNYQQLLFRLIWDYLIPIVIIGGLVRGTMEVFSIVERECDQPSGFAYWLQSIAWDFDLEMNLDDAKFTHLVDWFASWSLRIAAILGLTAFIAQVMLLRDYPPWQRIIGTTRCSIGVVLAGCILVANVTPMTTVAPSLRDQEGLSNPIFKTITTYAQSLHVANAYGVFRTITGTGPSWYDRYGCEHISIARPEVILEGSDDGNDWKEYHFRYKPGDVKARPSFVAPHQPRLDWQMWFAALSTINHNPWLVHLVHKLLHNSTTAIDMIDPSRNPFPEGPKYIRASLYHYNYTTLNDAFSSAWYNRVFVGPYMPAFKKDNSALVNFLQAHEFNPNVDPQCQYNDKTLTGQWMQTLRTINQEIVVCMVSFMAVCCAYEFLKWRRNVSFVSGRKTDRVPNDKKTN